MPFHMEWHTPYRVIDERLLGKVTHEDLRQITDLVARMLDEAMIHAPGKRVYLLFDDTEVESMPPAYLMIKQALPVLRYKNRGPMLHISHKKTIHSIVRLTAHVMRFPIRSLTTREEALEVLEKMMAKDDLHNAR